MVNENERGEEAAKKQLQEAKYPETNKGETSVR